MNTDYSKPLPTERGTHDRMQSNSNGIAGGDMWAATAVARHDPEYYTKWREERAAMVARGEDPNERFLARVEAAKQGNVLDRIATRFKQRKAKKLQKLPDDGGEQRGQEGNSVEERESLGRRVEGKNRGGGEGPEAVAEWRDIDEP